MPAAALTETPQPLTILTDEEQMFQATVRNFARKEIAPHVREMDDAGVFKKDILAKFFELGLMGIDIPEEYGGQGGTFFQSILAIEEIAAVDPSAGVIVISCKLLVTSTVRSGPMKNRSAGICLAWPKTRWSYALSEAGSGSDAFALQTRAVDRGDHYALTGRKLWITNAAEAGFYLVFANANPEAGYKGITCFIVERGFGGFQVGKKEDKLGIRASSTCELILDDCHVPKSNVMGEVGKGYKIAIETLNEGRIGIGAPNHWVSRKRHYGTPWPMRRTSSSARRSQSFKESSSIWLKWQPKRKPRV